MTKTDKLANSVSEIDSCAPDVYPRRVLLAVSGLSPQIVTETLFALTQSQCPAWVPTEIHLLTTTEGAHRARLSLFSEDLGWFHRLCTDYSLPSIAFDASHIHVLHDAQGLPMDDIRSVGDNGAAADAITAKVRELTADPQCALHVSIAGGRKSMGFYVGYALSLYGRAQDQLSHVLVSEPFENTLEFFYPTPNSRVLQTRDGRYADTKDAKVTLAYIPFVSLRHGMTTEFLAGNSTFQEAVEVAQIALRPRELQLHLRDRYIIASGKKIELPATGLALLAVFARRAIEGLPPVGAPHKELPDLQWKEWFEDEYRVIAKLKDHEDSTTESMKRGMVGGYFSMTKTRLADVLNKELGPAGAYYNIFDGGSRPRRYELPLNAAAIRFIG